jgi:large subunit ribosomal protein L25
MSSTSQTLTAQTRTVTGKKVKHLRTQGFIPATVYGKGFDPQSVQVNARAFNLLYRKTGKTALIDLQIDDVSAAVFVQALQRHPLSRDIIHVDFKVVNLKVAVQVEVPVITVGESPVVVRGDAMINHALSTVMVSALPAELPQHIEVDISGLTSFDKSIHVSDIAANVSYKILNDPDTVLISLSQLRSASEDEAAEVAPTEPELIRREREDEEEE